MKPLSATEHDYETKAVVLHPAGLWLASAFLLVLPLAHVAPWRVGLLILTSIIAAMLAWRERPPPFPCKLFFWFWVLASFFSVVSSVDPIYSRGEWRNEVVYPVLAFVSFYVLTRTPATLAHWARILIAGAFALSLYGLWQAIEESQWSPYWLGDANAYSTYIVLIAPLLLYALTRAGAGIVPIWMVVATLVLLIACGHFTLNRMLWPSLAAMVVVFYCLYRGKVRDSQGWRLATASIVVACITFAGFYLAAHVIRTSHGETNISDVNLNIDQDPRPHIWAFTLSKIQERPWTGFGFGRGILRRAFETHFQNELYWHGHNMFINVTLEAGIPGLIALVGLLAALGYEFWRAYRHPLLSVAGLGMVGLTVLVGIVLKSMTDDILVRENSVLFAALCGMALGVARRQQPSDEPKRPTTGFAGAG